MYLHKHIRRRGRCVFVVLPFKLKPLCFPQRLLPLAVHRPDPPRQSGVAGRPRPNHQVGTQEPVDLCLGHLDLVGGNAPLVAAADTSEQPSHSAAEARTTASTGGEEGRRQTSRGRLLLP